MSQNAEIIAYLKRKPITAMEALDKIGCFRLAARINDLKNMGYDIHTKIVDRNGKKFAEYYLIH